MPATRSGCLHSLPVTAVTTTVIAFTSESLRMNQVVGSHLLYLWSKMTSHRFLPSPEPDMFSRLFLPSPEHEMSSQLFVPLPVLKFLTIQRCHHPLGLHASDHVGITALSQPRLGQLQVTPSVNPTVPSASSAEMFPSREINLENLDRAPGYNQPQTRNNKNSHENPTIDNYWSQTPHIPDYIYPNVDLPAVTTDGRSNHESFKPSIKIPVFNGRGKWNTFSSQSEVFAEQLCRSESQKRQHLLAALTGDAADLVFDLEPNCCISYCELVHHLGNKFKEVRTPETCQRLFFSHTLRRDESVSIYIYIYIYIYREFAAYVKILSYRAFPTGLPNQAHEQTVFRWLGWPKC